MAHLVCSTHGRRVHVLEHGIVMHRNNVGVLPRYCSTTAVEINGKTYGALDVYRNTVAGATELYEPHPTWTKVKSFVPTDFTERITKSTQKITEALSDIGEKLREGNTATKLLHDIFEAPRAELYREEKMAPKKSPPEYGASWRALEDATDHIPREIFDN